MHELNFDNDSVIDPKDAEIEELRKQLDISNQRIVHQTEQLDQASNIIMGFIGHKVEALAESVAIREVERALEEFDINEHECAIHDMIDGRLPEPIDPDQESDDLKATIREVLASANVNANITLDLE